MGLKPIFCFLNVEDMQQHEALETVVVPIVEDLKLKFVGLQYFPQGKHSLIRLYVDKAGGVTIEDCERVSRQVNAVLSVEGTLKGDYTLEVSSPGLDRLLFSPAQCYEYIGKTVAIRLSVPMAGRRNFKGKLQDVTGEELSVLTDNGVITFSFRVIDEARVVPEW